MNQVVLQQLTRARTALVLDQPFFGVLALRLKLVEKPSIKTAAIDGKHIFYNPEFVAALSPAETLTLVAHEVMHCVYDHIGRRGGRNPRKYNKAGDYVINQALLDANFLPIKGWLHNPAFAGMSSEEVYNLLPDDDDNDGQGPGDDGEALDEVMDGDSEATEADATEWKVATVQAAQAAQAMGKLPASLKRFVDDMLAPKVDWRAVLQRFVAETSKNDYSWTRPNRRFIQQGIFLPTLFSENMGAVAVGIDTSGSIDQHTLNAFGSEVKAIVQSMRPEATTVIYCDAAVNHVDTFGPNDEMHFEMHGGGGTDFCPPFKYVEDNGLTPVCFVYLTDGYGPFPKDPGYPVLWVMTSKVVAPFGETVAIEI